MKNDKNDKYLTPAEFWEELKTNPIPYICVALFFVAMLAMIVFVTPYAANSPPPEYHIHWFGKMFFFVVFTTHYSPMHSLLSPCQEELF
jgi:hypothetical protein